MSAIREELVRAALKRSDFKTHDNFHGQHEFRQKTILADESLTKDEKIEAIRTLNETYDRNKVLYDEGTKRICKICNQECLATLYCEHCIRNYLKENFPNWSSGNVDIDNLIQKCQMETFEPGRVIEWIPYNDLQNIEYLTEGGCSKIYVAEWVNGGYEEWGPKEQRLKRFGSQGVVLKRLENVENANQNWLEEAKSHLTISNKWEFIVQCYGLTQDPSNGNYMLVMNIMNKDLKNYLQQSHNQLTWKERIQIAVDIIYALEKIHGENAIHRDLHSGNILYLKISQRFRIGDLGFCGPADKSPNSIYGNLPYIAPEVIAKKEYTFKSDIYSIAMLMWEISSGQPPFSNYEHDFDFVMNIINGMRPKVVSGTPIEYQSLMEQCWDADPLKRPDIFTLKTKISEINLHYQNVPNVQPESSNNLKNSKVNYTRSISKVHQFENMPKPRSATKEERKAFYTKSYDFCIPDNIDEVDDENLDESSNRHKDNLPKVFNELQRILLKNDNQNNATNKEKLSCCLPNNKDEWKVLDDGRVYIVIKFDEDISL